MAVKFFDGIPTILVNLSSMHAYIFILCSLYTVKSEMIKDQNLTLQDEKKSLQSQLEKQMQKLQKLQELSGNIIFYSNESRGLKIFMTFL